MNKKTARHNASQAIYDLIEMLNVIEAGIRYHPCASGTVLAYQRLLGPTSPQLCDVHQSLKELLKHADDQDEDYKSFYARSSNRNPP